LVFVGLALTGSALIESERTTLIVGLAASACGGSLGLVLSARGRQEIARVLPLDADAPRDWLGLVALAWLVILRLALYSQGESEVGEVSLVEAAIQALVLVAIALALIGTFLRRDLRQALDRLGLRPLSTRGYLIATLGVIPFIVVSAASALLVDYVQPGTLDELEETVTGITGGDTNIQFGLLLGISAAVGEETLFRGALQPKYGLVFTSLIFALLHVQYDVLLVVGSLFPAGLILGLERKYLGTTAAIVTHTLYNALAVAGGS